jgi:hypothetical protein
MARKPKGKAQSKALAIRQEEVLEGEILLPGEEPATKSAGDAKDTDQTDYTVNLKDIADTDPKFDAQEKKVVSHNKQTAHLLFTFAASASVMSMISNDVSYINRFMATLGADRRNMFRTNSWRIYFERTGPVEWDKNRMVKKGDREVKEPGFVMHKTKRATMQKNRAKDKASFDSGLLKTAPWNLAGPEQEYKAIDLPKLIAQLVKLAKRQTDEAYLERTSATEEDVKENDLRPLKDLMALSEKYPAKRRATHAGSSARN